MKKVDIIRAVRDVPIEYEWMDEDKTYLSTCDREEIQRKVEEGYVEGQLVHEDGTTGWWRIKR